MPCYLICRLPGFACPVYTSAFELVWYRRLLYYLCVCAFVLDYCAVWIITIWLLYDMSVVLSGILVTLEIYCLAFASIPRLCADSLSLLTKLPPLPLWLCYHVPCVLLLNYRLPCVLLPIICRFVGCSILLLLCKPLSPPYTWICVVKYWSLSLLFLSLALLSLAWFWLSVVYAWLLYQQLMVAIIVLWPLYQGLNWEIW
jgi:hypothetical protein